MKIVNNKWVIRLLIATILFSTACNQTKTENTSETKEADAIAAKTAIKTPEGFKSQLNETIKAYLATKDALVASDTNKTNIHVSSLMESLQKTDSATLTPEALQKWNVHKKAIIRSNETLRAAQKLEDKRIQFEDLSKAMYALVNDFGTSTTLYKQYCPMAMNDKGAFWLSAQNEIKNPYFGDAMLTCGEVQETLTFK